MRAVTLSLFTSLAAAGMLLAACGSGGGNPGVGPTVGPTTTPTTSPTGVTTPTPVPSGIVTSQSIAGANGVGAQIANTTVFAGSPTGGSGAGGTCTATGSTSSKFTRPDSHGDANSTETQTFFDNACTAAHLHTDVVRIFTPQTVNTESVSLTTTTIPTDGATKGITTQVQTLNYSNTTFDVNGFPNFAAGYTLVTNTDVKIDGVDTIRSGDEILSGAGSGNSVNFCANAAGYRAVAGTNGNSYAWSGQTLTTGTRTTNPDGSVTVSETHVGTPYNGPIPGLGLVQGSQNAACPIVTPMFTISGGTAGTTYNLPISLTFLAGAITNVTVTNGTFSSGLTLNVATSSSLPPTDPNFIVGTMTDANKNVVSTFGVNASGAGKLTYTSGSCSYIGAFHILSGVCP